MTVRYKARMNTSLFSSLRAMPILAQAAAGGLAEGASKAMGIVMLIGFIFGTICVVGGGFAIRRGDIQAFLCEILIARESFASLGFKWSGRRDSNPRPLEPHSSALPSCATARFRGPRRTADHRTDKKGDAPAGVKRFGGACRKIREVFSARAAATSRAA